jgi:leader peptidase (prepilin peptidase) / N-methyltransferase
LISLPLWFLIGGGAILGAICGSFIAALCRRWPKSQSVTRGRSRCDSCSQMIACFDLIPVISYVLLRGRCRNCSAKIGADALIIELVASTIGALSFLILPAPQALAASVFGWLLLPLIVLDLRHLWLPDRLIIALALTSALVGPLLTPQLSISDRLVGATAGYFALEAIRQIYRAVRKRDGMGAGDPKLFAALGIWLGWQSLPLVLLLASMLGLIWALAARVKTQAELPLGSFLGAAAIIILACA